ncbi:hypothetical protein BC940DRAFT_301884 [Gongronella butleri]|nr:hypothetical protein BC940DRAFT_301884 [Gongronella butleri]
MIPLYYKLLFVLFCVLAVQAQDVQEQQVDEPQQQQDGTALGAPVSVEDSAPDYFLDDELLEDEAEDDVEQQDEDDIDQSTAFDIDNEPLDYYGFAPDATPEDEEGDELGEEEFLVGDDEDDQDLHDIDDYLYEDDEEPLPFKNDEDIDLDQLLFDASLKDAPLEWPDDPLIAPPNLEDQDDHEHDHSPQAAHVHDPADPAASHDDVDELLANADDALQVADDGLLDDDGHPDHVHDDENDTQNQNQDQQQKQQDQQPPSIINEAPLQPATAASTTNASSTASPHYKVPMLAIIVLLGLLYKASNKRFHRRDRNDSYLPVHTKSMDMTNDSSKLSIRVDLHTPEHTPYPTSGNSTSTTPTKTASTPLPQPSPSSSHARRSSGIAATHTTGHTRRISATHSITKETKYNQ